MKNQYSKYKSNYKESIIVLKSGSFFVSYNMDAEIISKICNYQVVKNRVGFPSGSLDKVKNQLDIENINYVLIDKDEIFDHKEFNANKYKDYINKIDKEKYHNSLNKVLLDRIQYLIDYDNSNYDKIKKFIDEL